MLLITLSAPSIFWTLNNVVLSFPFYRLKKKIEALTSYVNHPRQHSASTLESRFKLRSQLRLLPNPVPGVWNRIPLYWFSTQITRQGSEHQAQEEGLALLEH